MKTLEVLAKFKAAFMLLGIGLLLMQPVGCANARPRFSRFWAARSFPVTLLLDSDIEESRRAEIILAAHTWNEEVGTNVFVIETTEISDYIYYGDIIEEPGHREIFVRETELGRADGEDILLGLAHRIYVDDHLTGCIIELDNDLARESIYPVSLHELGHCLGLEHDPNINSVMFEYVLRSSGDIEEEDLEFIRRQL